MSAPCPYPSLWWRVLRILGAVAVLAVVVLRLGTGPFVDGLRSVRPLTVLAAVALTAVTTACAAWRWSVVARRLGVGITSPVAVRAYYRSQFLNSVLPGGVLGDVHRAVLHGRDAGALGRGLRAVAYERGAGQVVQAALCAAVLALLPSPVPRPLAVVAAAAAVAVTLIAATFRDTRHALLARPVWPRVLIASVGVVAGHTATFLLAARAVGVTASFRELLVLAVLAQLAMSVPLSVGGWGPREGVAAWAFAATGLGAGTGVATATAYGMLALVATLPGLVVLALDARRTVAPPRRTVTVADG
jgi:uncharacterized membrane protein YbhN (UPF0104 family)